MKNDMLSISSKSKNYAVHFVEGFGFIGQLKDLRNGVFVIDRNVFCLYKKVFEDIDADRLILVDAKEQLKTIESAVQLYDTLLAGGFKRDAVLISCGGGIIQDITGFVASSLYRGVRWIYVPTSLLAQADSCVGSKTSLNFRSYKNIIGTFYPPDEIFICTDFLKTLDMKERYSGFGEVIRLHLTKANSIADMMLLADRIKMIKTTQDEIFLREMIKECLEIKKEYIEEDEFDTGRRILLNYGHTLAHAMESVSNFRIPHGLAVIIGMVFAGIVAKDRNLLDKIHFDVLVEKVLLPNLHLDILELEECFFDVNKLLDCMKQDKKIKNNRLALVIQTTEDGVIKINDLDMRECEKGIVDLKGIVLSK